MTPGRPRFGRRGTYIKVGPFVVFAWSNAPEFNDVVPVLYADFHIGVEYISGPWRWFRPQAIIDIDGMQPFTPLRGELAPLLFEGGLNWQFAMQTNFYFALHAAVVERGGRAVIMPGPPGAGKSTLCAVLVHRGWRLLSDEFALIGFDDGLVNPLARPIGLKNRAIDLIRDLAPDCVLSRLFKETVKGTVALLKPPRDSVRRMDEKAVPGWVIMPRYDPDVGAMLVPKPKFESFMELIDNAYNYHRLGRRSFGLLADLVGRSDCYDFRYSNVEAAVAVFDRLADAAG